MSQLQNDHINNKVCVMITLGNCSHLSAHVCGRCGRYHFTTSALCHPVTQHKQQLEKMRLIVLEDPRVGLHPGWLLSYGRGKLAGGWDSYLSSYT